MNRKMIFFLDENKEKPKIFPIAEAKWILTIICPDKNLRGFYLKCLDKDKEIVLACKT
jgi:hypothetical protein